MNAVNLNAPRALVSDIEGARVFVASVILAIQADLKFLPTMTQQELEAFKKKYGGGTVEIAAQRANETLKEDLLFSEKLDAVSGLYAFAGSEAFVDDMRGWISWAAKLLRKASKIPAKPGLATPNVGAPASSLTAKALPMAAILALAPALVHAGNIAAAAASVSGHPFAGAVIMGLLGAYIGGRVGINIKKTGDNMGDPFLRWLAGMLIGAVVGSFLGAYVGSHVSWSAIAGALDALGIVIAGAGIGGMIDYIRLRNASWLPRFLDKFLNQGFMIGAVAGIVAAMIAVSPSIAGALSALAIITAGSAIGGALDAWRNRDASWLHGFIDKGMKGLVIGALAGLILAAFAAPLIGHSLGF
jgi:hypothetical protein